MSRIIRIKINKVMTGGVRLLAISNSAIISTLEIHKRADFSFECGSFKFVSESINYNIPPYSICQIHDGNSYQYYCCSSECNSYLTTGQWVHDVSLLSLESILECYVLGAKTWSISNVGSDYQVCNYMTNLLRAQDTSFGFDSQNSFALLTSVNNEYTFPDGTTYYEAFKQVANKNNLRLRVSVNGSTFLGLGNVSFVISLLAQNQMQFNLVDTNGFLSFKKFQNTDNYCKYLLTCGTDVVDRDNKTTFKNLTVRASNGVVVDADHAELILPTRVEGITKFTIYDEITLAVSEIDSSTFTEAYVNARLEGGYTTDQYKRTYIKTLYEWSQESGESGTTWTAIREMLSDLSLDNSEFYVVYWFESHNCYAILNGIDTRTRKVDYTSHIIEKNVFDALDVAEQPLYAVYESGGNTIGNFNASYKKDFWNILNGHDVDGLFKATTSFNRSNSDININFTSKIVSETPLTARFDVECVPITNPILIDEKNDTPSNEDSYKPMTRPYSLGDSIGFVVDFKALSNDIDKQNETLGKIEAVLEVDASKILYEDTDDNDDYIESDYVPTPNDRINFTFKGTEYTFYVSSIVQRFTETKTIYQLNLTKTPYKVADAIGVDYQFNPTYLPLENIVERSLFFETTWDNFGGIIDSNVLLIRFVFGNGSGTSYQTLCARPAVMKASGYWLLYCEAMDNIVFGMSTNAVSGSDTKKSINNVPYGDENANCSHVSVYIEYKSSGSLSSSESYALPLPPSGTNYTHIALNKLIYKDSREKLTFTIKVKDSSLI